MLVFGIVGAIFMALEFPVAPILLGYVLGPLVEENFRRALLLSRGNMGVFLERPISLTFVIAVRAADRAAGVLRAAGGAWASRHAKRRVPYAGTPARAMPPGD